MTGRGRLVRLVSTLGVVPLLAVGPVPGVAGAGAPEALRSLGRPVVRPAVAHGVSRPLPEIVDSAARPGPARAVPLHPVARAVGRARSVPSPDPLLRSAHGTGLAASAAIPAPDVSLDGINNTQGVLPPDTNGDVGPNHYVQSVNIRFAVYSKAGALLLGPAAINTVFSGLPVGSPCRSENDGDPVVLYDQLADRWLISQFVIPDPYFQCVAISATPDPTGAWNAYQFLISTTKLNDYPKFGVWPDGYYMSVNQFTEPFFGWGGAGVVGFERDKMLLGQAAQMVYFDIGAVDLDFGGMLPSDLDGSTLPPAGSPNYFAEMDDDAWGWPSDRIHLFEFDVDWTTPASSTFTGPTALPTAAFDSNLCNYSRNCIPQPGTRRKLDALSDRLMFRLAYRNRSGVESLVMNQTVDVNGLNRAGVRWYEVRDLGGTPSIYQQGTVSPDSANRWMGSMAMDKDGNIALGYSVSSAAIFPSIRYTGRLADDPLGTMPQGEATLMAGSGSQTDTSSRWGDYSAMTVDPTDDCTFWYTNEYCASTSARGWRTRIGSFRFPGCGGGGEPPTTGVLTVTRAGTGGGKVISNPAGISCGSDCSETYPVDTEVTLKAKAKRGSVFAGWSGACSGAATTCTLTMDSDKAVTATFNLS